MPTEQESTPSRPISDLPGDLPAPSTGRALAPADDLLSDNRAARGAVPRGERIPPQDIEAEMSLLGSMMLSRDAIGDILPLIHRNESDRFYRPDHRRVFEVLVDMYDRGDPI
ncbi:MAG: hypothetical protein HY718_11500, partial [Planctomycetes bacterium]|nr:hypothetical protein [Planctomycetota bacterium]